MTPYPDVEGFVVTLVIMGVLSLWTDYSVKPVDLMWMVVDVGLCLFSSP